MCGQKKQVTPLQKLLCRQCRQPVAVVAVASAVHGASLYTIRPARYTALVSTSPLYNTACTLYCPGQHFPSIPYGLRAILPWSALPLYTIRPARYTALVSTSPLYNTACTLYCPGQRQCGQCVLAVWVSFTAESCVGGCDSTVNALFCLAENVGASACLK